MPKERNFGIENLVGIALQRKLLTKIKHLGQGLKSAEGLGRISQSRL